MRALLTPEIAPRMGIVLFRPGSELMPLFMQGRVLLEPEPERYSSFASGCDAIAGEWKTISASDNTYAIDNNEDAYELQINMDIADNENLTLTLSNEKGDKYPISLNRADKSFIIDRTQSGEVSFSSEFGKVLYSPLNLSSNAVSLTLFVDKSSVEALINDGMVQQTNLVYPSGIYNSLSVESGKGQIIKSVKVRTLSSVW